MDGKVEVSILQWEQIREEVKAKTEKIAELEKQAKTVKLVITEKNLSGHFKFNRWTNMNEWIPETHDVERIEYAGLDDIKKVLFEEAKDQVQSTLQNLEAKQAELDATIRTLKKNHEEEKHKLNEKHDEEIKKTKVLHEQTLKVQQDRNNEKVKSLEEKNERLQNIINEKQVVKEEERKAKELQDLKDKVEELTIQLADAKKKVPFWRK